MNKREESGLVFVAPFGLDTPQDLDFNESTPWMNDLLKELEEDLDSEDLNHPTLSNRSLSFSGEAVKKTNPSYDDYVLLTGVLKSEYRTYCITSGELMQDTLEAEVKAVFLAKALNEKLELADEVSFYIDEDEYDLFYFESRHIDLKACLHEYLFLNKNQYPKIEGAVVPQIK